MRPFLAIPLLLLAVAVPSSRAQPPDTLRYTISGDIVEETTGDPVAQAWIQVEGTRIAAVSDSQGRYVLARVPRGYRRIEASRVGYVTVSEMLPVDRDLTLRLELTPKPIVLEGIHVTLNRMESRRNALPYAVTVFDEDDLLRANALDAADFVERRTGLALVPCRDGSVSCVLSRGGRAFLRVVIDEVELPGGLIWLMGFPLSEIDTVEVVRRCAMVRVYTKPFMERVASGKRSLDVFLSC